ncbi:MAG: HAMP domain-containing histidine kinase [Lachnospiraceae bacterium]|nr:HAMP domain-containing histidine kinase [Lachnospiraceae bacterium]
MKLRTKLSIAFFSVIIFPPILIFLATTTRIFKHSIPAYNTFALNGNAYMSLFFALILTGIMVTVWLYHSMISPIKQLTEATRKIAEGDLDFQVELPNGDDEIAALCSNFEEMRKRLQKSAAETMENESENRTLISNITHDLKTPVTSIKGYAEGLLDGVADTPEKRDKYIQTIYNKANDMDRLINELTFYAGIDTNRIPYNFTRIDVSDYFGDCVDEIQVDLESHGISLSYENALKSGVRIIADPEQFKKVINNIIGNSIKYMDKKGGKLSIRLKDAESAVIIEIEDNGKGIAKKDLPYIFDRFYRTDSSRNSSRGGSGIGLSIVKKIVEDHGGRVWAESDLGSGTTILMEFRKYKEK